MRASRPSVNMYLQDFVDNMKRRSETKNGPPDEQKTSNVRSSPEKQARHDQIQDDINRKMKDMTDRNFINYPGTKPVSKLNSYIPTPNMNSRAPTPER